MFNRGFAIALCLAQAAILIPAATIPAKDPTPEEVQKIIKQFTQKETEFAAAREDYTYRQTTKLTETEPAGGSYQIVEDIAFDNRGRKTFHVVRAPVASLQNIQMTAEDEQDLRNVMPFVMTNDTADQYNVKYLRHEKVDEITCYVFSVHPKELTKDRKRYFDGDIWVDDRDFQIVKTFGKATGYLKKGEDQQFPKFETYREQVDGKYWFPTYTYANDTLNFKDSSQRIKEVIKYDDYKRFKSESTIQYGDVTADTPPAQNPPAAPAPPKP